MWVQILNHQAAASFLSPCFHLPGLPKWGTNLEEPFAKSASAVIANWVCYQEEGTAEKTHTETVSNLRNLDHIMKPEGKETRKETHAPNQQCKLPGFFSH